LVQFGRDSLAASIAFAWYGVAGQLFVPASRLWPSTFVNDELFLHWFGFPVQVFRAVLAVLIAIFVIRFMRAFDTEIQGQIEELQAMRLEEARRREALRGGLIKRIVAAQEAERQRIARELHDDTGQALTALGLGLRGVSRTVKVDQNKAAHNLRLLEELASNSLNELQRIIANLRPSHLDDLGLAAAIRWFINDVQNHTEIQLTFTQQREEVPVSDEVKIAIYRVVQEAITNAIKYSSAENVNVELCFTDKTINVRIEDDGVGMDVDTLRTRREQSWGILGMRERAQLLDGEFKIDSSPGRGVHVSVSIPYQLAELKLEEIEVEDD
jgi:signal transduction histidine kinase